MMTTMNDNDNKNLGKKYSNKIFKKFSKNKFFFSKKKIFKKNFQKKKISKIFLKIFKKKF